MKKSLAYHQKESCALHVYRRPSCLYYRMTVCVDMDTYYITTKRSLVTSRIPCVTTYTQNTRYIRKNIHSCIHHSFPDAQTSCVLVYTHCDEIMIANLHALTVRYTIYVQYKRWMHGTKQTNACFE